MAISQQQRLENSAATSTMKAAVVEADVPGVGLKERLLHACED